MKVRSTSKSVLLAASILIGLPLIYLLSTGPMLKMFPEAVISNGVFTGSAKYYAPLDYAARHNKTFWKAMDYYIRNLWHVEPIWGSWNPDSGYICVLPQTDPHANPNMFDLPPFNKGTNKP
jgi:hypothetical protein